MGKPQSMRQRAKQVAILVLTLAVSGALAPAAGAAPTAQQGESLLAAPEQPSAPGLGQNPGGQSARLVSSTATSVTLEVHVPWESLLVEPVTADGREYARVTIPGWQVTEAAGAPALPMLAQTLGAPFGASVAVNVTPGPAHTQTLPAPALPAPTQRVELGLPSADGSAILPEPALVVEEDSAIYSGAEAYPRALAVVTNDGVLRQQRVIGVSVYPVEYDPAARAITIYESLRVEVSFGDAEGLAVAAPAKAESPAYEQLFQTSLLNYEASRSWRSSALPSPSGRGAGGEVAGGEGAGAADVESQALPWAPPVPGWRVKVRADGMYRLTYAELLAAGVLTDTLVPGTFQMYYMGQEIPIHVEGEEDEHFDPGDSIIFYGQAISSKYTRDNVYWLTYGNAVGLRMIPCDGAPVVMDTPAYYMARRQMESNAYYLALAPGTESMERWAWDYIYAPSRPKWTYPISLASPYTGTGTLTVAMLGYLQNAINPDHHTKIYLNGTVLEDAWWDGLTWKVSSLVVPENVLVAGTNTISVTCPNDTGVGYDVVYIDWAEIAFPNTFTAEANVLPFTYDVPGTWKYLVNGFTTDQVAVYDVTNPFGVSRIEGAVVAPSGAGYAASFQDTVASSSSYYALADSAYKTVQAIEPDAASNLRSTGNGADYIIITHATFAAQAEQLRAFRAAQGLRSVVVDVRDVYDEFGYGVESASAIHEFLAYAYGNWQPPAPQYVLLFGDGHYDPKNYAGYGRTSFITPYLAPVDPWLGETAADNRFVTLVGSDTMPDMMLGRLAVNDTAEAAAFVSKIIAYEQSPVPGEWQQQVLAVADNADSAGNFAAMSDNLIADCVPLPLQTTKVYLGVTHSTAADARAAIQAAINAGRLIVNYIGHAYTQAWAAENLLTASDVPSLSNGGKLPVVLAMTCREGYFHYPHPPANKMDALAEVVTRADGRGAVASWSPTGLGVASGHDYLNRGFLDAMLRDAVGTIGKGTTAGKLRLWATGTSLDLLDTYLLFGDPAQRMILAPTAVDLASFSATGAKHSIILNWETASEIETLGFNVYRAARVDGPRMKLNSALIPSLVPPGSPFGAVYEYVDENLPRARRLPYYYWLEAVDIYGGKTLHGPVEARMK